MLQNESSSLVLFGVWLTTSWFRLALITIASIVLANYLFKKWLQDRRFRAQIDLLPGPPTHGRLLGNIPSKVLSLVLPEFLQVDTSSNLADEFYLSQIQSLCGHTLIYQKEPIFRIWIGQEPVICVWKAETMEQVLSDNFLLEKSYHYDFLRPWLGDGLLTSPGKIWRRRRKLLVPSFHFNILRAFVPVFDRKSKLMVRNIKRSLNEKLKVSAKDQVREGEEYEENRHIKRNNNTTSTGIDCSTLHSNSNSNPDSNINNTNNNNNDKHGIVVDITPLITACTLDAICETIMGVSIDAQECPENEYCKSIYIVGETFLERIIQPRYWLDWLFQFTELGKLYNYHLKKLHSFTRQVIAEKKALYYRKMNVENSATSTSTPGGGNKDNDGAPKEDKTKPLKEHQNFQINQKNAKVAVDLIARMKVLKETSIDSYENSNCENNKDNVSAGGQNAAAAVVPKLPKAFLDLLLDKVIAHERLSSQQYAHQAKSNTRTNSNATTDQNPQSQILTMSDEDIREEVDTFMFEGHDTTAMALSWTLFLLGHNLSVQQKLQVEVDQLYAECFSRRDLKPDELIDSVNHDDPQQLNLDHLKQLRYLDCVIKEALRLCPSVPFIGRKTTNELKLANYTVPPGCVIFLLIYQLHRDPKVFPKPEMFDPDRFLPENTLARHPFAYVPFSAGSRNCIGQKFALAEMKTILFNLIRNFTFESVTPLDKAQVRMEMVLRPKSALNIRIKPRTHNR